MRIEYHRTLIADTVRNVAFHRALKALIEPGETVVADIGAGTGLLGVMAAQLGAKEIFLYEVGEVASVAERTIARSGFDNCHLMPCHSTEMYDPPKLDLIVSETLGNYAFEEDIIATLNDARRRCLKKGGQDHTARDLAICAARDWCSFASGADGLGRNGKTLWAGFDGRSANEPQQCLCAAIARERVA